MGSSKRTLVYNGKILTMGGASRPMGYMLIEGGRVVEVGDAPAAALREGAECIDARGRLVTPGLIDTHAHFTLTGLLLLNGVDLFEAESVGDVQRMLADRARQGNRRPWLIGYNLNEYRLKEGRLPDRFELDEVSGETPILVNEISYHYGSVNSKALEVAAVGRDTHDPTGGRLGRLADDRPNGVLYEFPAINLVKSHMPRFTSEDYVQAIRLASERFIAEGITTVKDPGTGSRDISEETRLEVMRSLAGSGEMKLRLRILLSLISVEDLGLILSLSKDTPDTEMIRYIGFKIHLDGTVASRTAWAKDPWNVDFEKQDGENRGFPLHRMDDLHRILVEFNRAGKMAGIHTEGDMAIETALNEIEHIQDNHKERARFTLIHAYIPTDAQLERAKRLGVYLETQTSFLYLVGDMLIPSLGKERASRFYPLRTCLERGVVVGNGSDASFPYPPKYGLYAAVTRRLQRPYRGVEVSREEEGVDIVSALSTYTSLASKCVNDEGLGVLESGRLADFVIWEKDFTSYRRPEEILEMRPEAVYVSGRRVH